MVRTQEPNNGLLAFNQLYQICNIVHRPGEIYYELYGVAGYHSAHSLKVEYCIPLN